MTRAELIQYINANIYPNGRNQVTAPMVRDSVLAVVSFLGDAAVKDIGAVLENNTGLVTGGAVYDAIRTYLSSVLRIVGTTTTAISDGSTTNPVDIDGVPYTASRGDVVLYGAKEFWWDGSKWEELGDEASWALKTISITGTGYLEGGGDLTQNRTLNLTSAAQTKVEHGETAYTSITDWFEEINLGDAQNPSWALRLKKKNNTFGRAFITYGDQIVESGTPGGGDVQPHYLYELYDVDFNAASLLGGELLTFNYSEQKWVTIASSQIGSVKKVAVGSTQYSPDSSGIVSLPAYPTIPSTYAWSAITSTPTTLSGYGITDASINNGVITLGSETITPYVRPSAGIPNTDLANSSITIGSTLFNLGDTKTSLAGLVNVTMSGTLKIGDAELEWIAPVGTTPGYLKLNSAFLSLGDQIVGSGTPGGGGGGAGYLYELGDIYHDTDKTKVLRTDGTTPAAVGDVLQLTSLTGGNKWAAVPATDIGRVYSGGTGITINPNTNEISVTANTYLPLTGGTISSTRGAPVTINSTSSSGQSVILFQTSTTNKTAVGYLSSVGSYLYDYTTSAYINIDSSGEIKKNNTYTFYHSGNSNKSDVAWACSTLTASSHIYMANNTDIYWKDTSSTDRLMMRFNASHQLLIGYGTIAKSGTTFIYGNAITFNTGSTPTEYMRIISSGNVGIGTATPGYKLHVSGTSGASVTPMSVFEHTGDYLWDGLVAFLAPNLTTQHNVFLGIGKATSTKNEGALEFYYAGNSSNSNLFGLGLYGVDYVLTVSGGGNVGIGLGTTPASFKLDVAGQMRSTMIYFTDLTSNIGYVGKGTSANNNIYLGSYNNGHVLLMPNGDGNVGIGTASPGYKLEVNGNAAINGPSSGETLRLTKSNTGYPGIEFIGSSTNSIVEGGNNFNIYTNSANRFTILQNGNVGIGASSPSHKLEVSGSDSYGLIYANNTNTSGWVWDAAFINPNLPNGNNALLLIGYAATAGNSGWLAYHNAGTASTSNCIGLGFHSKNWLINAYYSGNVTIGTENTTDYGYKLYVAGAICSTGDQIISSDINLKTHFKDITLTSEQIANAPAVSFDWKDGHGHSFGSIAQYWRPLVPEAVLGEEGNYTLAYGQLGAVLGINNGKAIFKLEQHETEQDKEIKKLKDKVAKQNREILRLKARLNMNRV